MLKISYKFHINNIFVDVQLTYNVSLHTESRIVHYNFNEK